MSSTTGGSRIWHRSQHDDYGLSLHKFSGSPLHGVSASCVNFLCKIKVRTFELISQDQLLPTTETMYWSPSSVQSSQSPSRARLGSVNTSGCPSLSKSMASAFRNPYRSPLFRKVVCIEISIFFPSAKETAHFTTGFQSLKLCLSKSTLSARRRSFQSLRIWVGIGIVCRCSFMYQHAILHQLPDFLSVSRSFLVNSSSSSMSSCSWRSRSAFSRSRDFSASRAAPACPCCAAFQYH